MYIPEMSCKRSLLPEACRNRKRICAARKSDENVPDTTWDANENFGKTDLYIIIHIV